jgi:hypothetical protein
VLADLSPAERHAYLHGTSYTDFLRTRFELPDAACRFQQRAVGSGEFRLNISRSRNACRWACRARMSGRAHDEDTEERDSPKRCSRRQQLDRAADRALPDPGGRAGDDGGRRSLRHRDDSPDYARSTGRALPSVAAQFDGRPRGKRNGGGVAVDYVKDGSVRVTAKQAVLACYNMIIPYIARSCRRRRKRAREMREAADARGQHAAARRPGAAGARHQGRAAPGSFLQNQFLVTGINVGDYHPTWRPEDPA